MSDTPLFHVLVPAAGTGSRAGGALPKQYQTIHGKTVLRHTLDALLSCEGIQSLRVIIDPEWITAYQEAVQGLDIGPFIEGSKTRKQSIFNGINEISHLKDEDIVLVHDAARPFVSAACISECAKAAARDGAATLAAHIHDTIVEAEGYTRLDRERLRSIQTPQGFQYGILKQAHNHFKNNDNFTDDAGMVAAMGHAVTLVAVGERLVVDP